jgi:hypothetical protein
MPDSFVAILLGHLVGDFMLQGKHMALTKSERSWAGFWMCTLHVAIYTATVCAFVWTIDPIFIVAVAVPHWLIDRYSLATLWLKLIRGRTFESAYLSTDKFREFDIAFTSIVYTVTDSTMHLLCLWAAIRFLM